MFHVELIVHGSLEELSTPIFMINKDANKGTGQK